MSDHEINDERKKAIKFAEALGWQVSRKSRTTWEFKQPDTGGLWDLFRIPHKQLSVRAVLYRQQAYDAALMNAVTNATETVQNDWLLEHHPEFATRGESE